MKEFFALVDLFAGAGGFSEGFKQAGNFFIALALDEWKSAEIAFLRNHPEAKFLRKNVKDLSGKELLRAANLSEVDVVIGGPPCQGFSTSGKRALGDPRNALVKEFLRLVKELKPKVFVFENTEGFPSFDRGKLLDELQSEFSKGGYRTWPGSLKATDHGVPQKRERFFLVGSRSDKTFLFPESSHCAPEKVNLFSSNKECWLTFWDAVSDLPVIPAGGAINRYSSPPQNEYQKERRKNCQELPLHRAPNHSEKIKSLLKYIPPGKSAFDVWDQIPSHLRPTSGFLNSYGRIRADRPAPTMTRNFTTPSSAQCVHPYVDRALTLREGARVQSFDDDYKFADSFSENRVLIGNAVPPLLAKALACSVREFLRDSCTVEVDHEKQKAILR